MAIVIPKNVMEKYVIKCYNLNIKCSQRLVGKMKCYYNTEKLTKQVWIEFIKEGLIYTVRRRNGKI